MWKGDKVQILQERGQLVIQVIDNHLKFRKDEDFTKKIILAYHDNPFKAYVLEKVSDFFYEVKQPLDKSFSKFSARSIKNYVDGNSDVYILSGYLYNQANKVVGYLNSRLQDYLSRSTNVCIRGILVDTFTQSYVYICFIEEKSVMLFQQKPRVLFVSNKEKRMLKNITDFLLPQSKDDVQVFDDIVFKDFKITNELVQKLSLLETVEEMRDMLKRELLMSVV
jgi:uncharacterized protein (DUF2164 family)